MYKPGDLVQLRSGSPDMTVVSCDGDHTVCTYYSYLRELFTTWEGPSEPLVPISAGLEVAPDCDNDDEDQYDH